MPLPRMISILLALAVWPLTAMAQNTPPADSSRAQIQQTLRSWYFSLAHHDWNAVTDDILAAKVVAHRLPPVLLRNQEIESAAVMEERRCAAGETAVVDAARIYWNGDWAQVWVPRCGVGFTGGDSFRLIHFEQRWRFVYIDLYKERSPIDRKLSDRR